MMNLSEYAEDVNKSVDEIKALCDKIGITYEDENSSLSEDDIILLDNELQDNEDYIDGEIDEDLLEEVVSEKAEALAEAANIDLDNQEKFEKVKTKVVKQRLKIISLKKERKFTNIVKNYKVMNLNKMIMYFFIKKV